MYLFENIFSILLGCISRNGSAEWLSKSRVIILRNPKLFSTASKRFYISTSNIQGFQFLNILANSCICCDFLIIITILIGMKGYLTMVLTWLSLIINDVECAFNDLFIKKINDLFIKKLMIFSCVIGYFTYLFWKNLYSSLLPFLIELLMVTEVFHFLYCSLDQIHDLQIFSPILWVGFFGLDRILWFTKVLNFDEIQFMLLVLLTSYLRNHWHIKDFPLFFYIVLTFFPTLHSLWDLSFLIRDWTQATAVKVLSLNHWITREFPVVLILKFRNLVLKALFFHLFKKNCLSIWLYWVLVASCGI